MKSPLHQMSENERLEALHPIFAALGETPKETKSLGSGARSWVWRVRSNKGIYAFKIYKPIDGALPPETDAELRRLLAEKGAKVSRPCLTSRDVPLPGLEYVWSLDEFIRGRRVSKNLSPQHARGFGQTLRRLHELDPADLKAAAPILVSPPLPVALTFGAGFPSDFGHPLSSLRIPLKKTLETITRFATETRQDTAICHADLHRKQLINCDRNTLALLDFSEARLAHRNWDLGAVLLEFGPDVYTRFYDGYQLYPAENPVVLSFARCLAFARLHRGRVGQKKAAREFLRSTENLTTF